MHLGNGLSKPTGDVGQRLKNKLWILGCQSYTLGQSDFIIIFQ